MMDEQKILGVLVEGFKQKDRIEFKKYFDFFFSKCLSEELFIRVHIPLLHRLFMRMNCRSPEWLFSLLELHLIINDVVLDLQRARDSGIESEEAVLSRFVNTFVKDFNEVTVVGVYHV